MSPSLHAVLVTVRDEYEATGKAPDERHVAATLGTAPSRIDPVLQALCRVEFLAPTGDGYRPTMTGHEFLELEVTLDNVAVIDVANE